MAQPSSTLDRIKEVGFAEFLEKGFQGASLRKIVKMAGVTTGAFYGYYPSKEALFEDLVQPHYEYLHTYIQESIEEFSALAIEEQAAVVGSYRQEQFAEAIRHIYTNREVFTLLLFRSQGTKYEHAIDEMVDIEANYALTFLSRMAGRYGGTPTVYSYFSTMMMRSFFTHIFELIAQAPTAQDAIQMVTHLKIFHTAGWMHLLETPIPTSHECAR